MSLKAEPAPTLADKLRRLAAEGLTQAQAADTLGISRQRVGQAVAQGGLHLLFTRGWIRTTEADLAALRACAAEGLTAPAAAARMGWPEARLRGVAIHHNITLARLKTGPKRNAVTQTAATSLRRFHNVLTPAQLADARLLRKNAGYSLPDTLRAIGRADLAAQVAA